MLRTPWSDWSLPLILFGAWPALFVTPMVVADGGANVWLGVLVATLVCLLLLGQGGGWLARYWDSPAIFRAERWGMRALTPLLLLHLAFALPTEQGLVKLITAQPLSSASVPLLIVYCWMTLGWSGLYDYNPLVLQLARWCLYATTLLLAGQLWLLQPNFWLVLVVALPLASRVGLWLRRRRYTLMSCASQGDQVRILTLEPCGQGFDYRAGQFCYVSFPWSFPAPMRGEFPLSFASAPSRPLRFLVRLKHDQDVATGRVLKLRSAQGYLFRRVEAYPRLLLLASGLGAGPYLSLFEQWALEGGDKPAELHWFVREQDDVLLADLLARWQKTLTRLRIFRYTALTRPQIQQVVNELLSVPDRESGVFFCGSLAFNRMVRQAALTREWPAALLNYQFI